MLRDQKGIPERSVQVKDICGRDWAQVLFYVRAIHGATTFRAKKHQFPRLSPSNVVHSCIYVIAGCGFGLKGQGLIFFHSTTKDVSTLRTILSGCEKSRTVDTGRQFCLPLGRTRSLLKGNSITSTTVENVGQRSASVGKR